MKLTDIDLQIVRHLLLRFCLGFILGWFGIQQVTSPGEWTSYVPEVVSNHSPVGDMWLILAHGTLLLLAAMGICSGLFPRSACALAVALILEIIVVLFLKGDSGGLIVRDLGLLAMAVVLTFDHFPVVTIKFPHWPRRNSQHERRPLSLSR